jgi:hypothetical protein
MYLMVSTSPNLSHFVEVMCGFMVNLDKKHWTMVKQILRYLQGIKDYVICYRGMEATSFKCIGKL